MASNKEPLKMLLPLRVLVSPPTSQSPQAFAHEALRLLQDYDQVETEMIDDRLVIRALAELDLENAVWILKQNIAGIACSKPIVDYVEGPPTLEPFHLATVDIPSDRLTAVMADLLLRRSVVLSVGNGPLGYRLQVRMPVAEHFGYTTMLRAITNRQGTVSFAFLDYQPAGGSGTADGSGAEMA